MSSSKHVNIAMYILGSSLLVGALQASAQQPVRPEDKQLILFDQLIQGQFDNYNQINFQTNNFLSAQDKPSKPHTRLYISHDKIDAPWLGEYVYYQRTHSGGRDKPVYRHGIMVAEADYQQGGVRVAQYKFHQHKAFDDVDAETMSLSEADIYRFGDGCDALFKQVGEGFIGGISPDTCRVKGRSGRQIGIKTAQYLGADAFYHLEEGYSVDGQELFGREDDIPHKLLRARPFKCWAAFKTDKLKENGEPHWDFFPNIVVHDQGDIAEFTTTESAPKSYFIRLKQTQFPAGSRPDVFELFVHENNQEAKQQYSKALSYTWTNSDAKRLGINLRWMQSSCALLND